MAVSNINEMPQRWAEGVQGKQAKFERSLGGDWADNVAQGLQAIGVNPGSTYLNALRGVNPGAAADAWATKVQGKQDKLLRNYLDAVES